jgi:hypothetical protein
MEFVVWDGILGKQGAVFGFAQTALRLSSAVFGCLRLRSDSTQTALRQHSDNAQTALREHLDSSHRLRSDSTQTALRQHSDSTQGALREHLDSVSVWNTFIRA